MTMLSPAAAASFGGDLFLSEILADCRADDGVRMTVKDPFLCLERDSGATANALLREAHNALTVAPRTTQVFAGVGAWARAWQAEFDGYVIEGVTAAVREAHELQVRIMVRSLPVAALWRAEVRRRTDGLVASSDWELLAGTDQSIGAAAAPLPVDAHLPFGLSEDVVFHSPVLTRPVRGAALVQEVIGNATAVYGARTGGINLVTGPELLSLWTGSVSGLPLEAASLVRLDRERRATSISVLMQPVPAVRLFRDRVRARTRHLLDDALFELE